MSTLSQKYNVPGHISVSACNLDLAHSTDFVPKLVLLLS